MSTDLVPSSTRRWDLARQAAGAVLLAAPWLDDPVYDASVRSLAFAEATAQLLRERLDRQGDVLEDGRPSPLLRELRAWQAQAARERGDLGLNPVARQRLGRSAKTGKTIIDLMAELPDEDAEVIPTPEEAP